MATIESTYLQTAREQLETRLERLENLLQQQPNQQVERLITEVDRAIERIDTGHFGVCTVCHESVEADRLMHDPLVSVCLGVCRRRSNGRWNMTWSWRRGFRAGCCRSRM